MNIYLAKVVDFVKNSKMCMEVIVEKITLKAKTSGKSFKEYIYEDTNVSHISLVVYDILPLPVKLGLRYEKFDKAFVNNFSFIREKLFDKPESATKVTVPAKKAAAKKAASDTVVVNRTPAKKAPAKKSVAVKKSVKPAAKKVVAKKVAVKKVAAKKTTTKK